jgi:hypothetical protein
LLYALMNVWTAAVQAASPIAYASMSYTRTLPRPRARAVACVAASLAALVPWAAAWAGMIFGLVVVRQGACRPT